MALLELTALARGPAAGRDLAVYVDHGLRAESKEEAALVGRAAERWDVEAVTRRIPPGGSDEDSLRRRRYAALCSLAEERGCEFVLTGHTRDDQIETVLHRLVRGAGRRGLGGVPVRRGRFVRPLLGFEREELRSLLGARGVPWCEDPSNDDPRYARNRLRHDIVPALRRSFGHGALDHLATLAETWTAEDDYLEGEARRFAAFAVVGPPSRPRLDAGALAMTPPALRARVVRRWLAQAADREASAFTHADLTAVVALAEGAPGTRHLDLRGLVVTAAYGRLDVVPSGGRDADGIAKGERFRYDLPLDADRVVHGPDGWTVKVTAGSRFTGGPPRSFVSDVLALDPHALDDALTLRAHSAGDRIRLAFGGTRKVSDLMIDRRLPSTARRAWPVIACGTTIVWVPGVEADGQFFAKPGGAPCLQLQWQRPPLA